jgi:hypothetical protein
LGPRIVTDRKPRQVLLLFRQKFDEGIVSHGGVWKKTERQAKVSVTGNKSRSPRVCFLFARSTVELFWSFGLCVFFTAL